MPIPLYKCTICRKEFNVLESETKDMFYCSKRCVRLARKREAKELPYLLKKSLEMFRKK